MTTDAEQRDVAIQAAIDRHMPPDDDDAGDYPTILPLPVTRRGRVVWDGATVSSWPEPVACSERLPAEDPESVFVLAWSYQEGMWIAGHFHAGCFYGPHGWDRSVTHWTPMPPAPRS